MDVVTPAAVERLVTSADVEAAGGSLARAESERDRLTVALAARRARMAAGADAAERDRLRAVLADATVMALVNAADVASAGAARAEAEYRRCGSRGGRRETELAAGRRNAVAHTRAAAERARGPALAALAAAGCPVPPDYARHGCGIRNALDAALRGATHLADDTELTRDLARAAAEVEARATALAAAREACVPAERVEAVARATDPAACAILARLVAGYRPKRETVAREPAYAALAAAGLADVSEWGAAAVTAFGREVSRWAGEHLHEPTRARRALAPAVGALTPTERRRVAERCRAALAALAAGELPLAQCSVEVGEPAAGWSYRLTPDRDVLTWFLASMRAPSDP